jgi:putative membrane protein
VTRSRPSLQLGLVLATVLVVAASFVGTEHLFDLALHHLPTLVVLPLLAHGARRRWLGDGAFVATILFLWIHTLGARYLYSFVPYDDWARAVFGSGVTETFGFRRNHYDRLVHAAYGFLVTFPQVELLERRLGTRAAFAASLALVLAVGSLYEMAEFGVAIALDPVHADRYNGQQGDAWDAQKDTALAFLGAVVATAAIALGRRGLSPGACGVRPRSPPARG